MEQQNNTLTIAALVMGIVAIVLDFTFVPLGVIVGILGIAMAVQARKKEGNSSMATGGLVCSIVAVAIGGAMLLCVICAVGFYADITESIVANL